MEFIRDMLTVSKNGDYFSVLEFFLYFTHLVITRINIMSSGYSGLLFSLWRQMWSQYSSNSINDIILFYASLSAFWAPYN